MIPISMFNGRWTREVWLVLENREYLMIPISMFNGRWTTRRAAENTLSRSQHQACAGSMSPKEGRIRREVRCSMTAFAGDRVTDVTDTPVLAAKHATQQLTPRCHQRVIVSVFGR